MIYITGDIHGSISVASRFNSRNFPEGRTLTKQDYVIIVGDFGLLWADDAEDRFWLKWLTEKPWTTLFIDGNHENFDLLESYPVFEWNGGRVHHITPSIISVKPKKGAEKNCPSKTH
ncbi:metallophosphoesterase family protein [Paenibacillus sp. FSL R7-0204]|uniref:metallophosphoesterase family protein n=1 Tax=Paenibacillus sp. FSL R7-0204 TaxID=2921675 RepID=UPI0030FBD56A